MRSKYLSLASPTSKVASSATVPTRCHAETPRRRSSKYPPTASRPRKAPREPVFPSVTMRNTVAAASRARDQHRQVVDVIVSDIPQTTIRPHLRARQDDGGEQRDAPELEPRETAQVGEPANARSDQQHQDHRADIVLEHLVQTESGV